MFASHSRKSKTSWARLMVMIGLALALAGPAFVSPSGTVHAGGSFQGSGQPSGG